MIILLIKYIDNKTNYNSNINNDKPINFINIIQRQVLLISVTQTVE